MAREDEVLNAVIDGLIAHVTRCPNAADTADGIREWWLADLPPVDPHIVDAALDRLVAAGVLERAASTSGTPVFRGARRARG